MLICPKCRYEYRDGFKICPDCNRSLIEVKANTEVGNTNDKITGYLGASLAVCVLLCIVLSIFLAPIAVVLIFVGSVFIILGFFSMGNLSMKQNVVEPVFSLILLDRFFSGIGSIVFGMLMVLTGTAIAFN